MSKNPKITLIMYYEVISTAAILIGPVLAVQVQKWLERDRERHENREWIFKTLMASRAATISPRHVEALNQIDLEFPAEKAKYRRVVNAWKEYFDVLSEPAGVGDQLLRWAERRNELLTNLLFEMSNALNYKFDKLVIKRGIYSPKGHADLEAQNQAIRDGWLQVLRGEVAIPILVIEPDDD